MPAIWGIYHYNKCQKVTQTEMVKMGEESKVQGVFRQETLIFEAIGLGQLVLNRYQKSQVRYPLTNEDKTLFLVFDGFISNHNELKMFLIKRGHHFGLEAEPAEVVLHLFEDKREEGLQQLNGMFAFAIWDDKEKKLILVRDRFGIKPLYYNDDGKSLIFSSWIRPILKREGVGKELNFQAFYDYLSLNYVPFSQTLFRGIERVPPKYCLKYSDKERSKKQYWDFKVESELKIGQKQIEEELGERLKAAVKSLLPLDGSVGVFLSGGLDSAAITYYLKELGQDPIDTFGISFKQRQYDESGYGQIVANHLNTKHYIIPLVDKFKKEYEGIIACYENLHAEPSIIPFYYLAQTAGRSKGYMLCGDSADELLGGYPELLADRLLPYYKKAPIIMQRLLNSIVDTFPVSDAPVSFDYKAKHFLRGAEKDHLRAHYYWREIFTEEEKHRLLTGNPYNQKMFPETFERYAQYINRYPCDDALKSFQFGYLNVLIPDNNLPYYNTLCAVHSIDIGYPFLDNELVNFMLKIPMSLKLKGMTTKYILRQLLRNKLPRIILSRKKQGLSCPIKIWIKKDMRDIFMDRLNKANLKKHTYFNIEYVQQLIREHLNRKVDNSRKIWGLFCFVVWYDKYSSDST